MDILKGSIRANAVIQNGGVKELLVRQLTIALIMKVANIQALVIAHVKEVELEQEADQLQKRQSEMPDLNVNVLVIIQL